MDRDEAIKILNYRGQSINEDNINRLLKMSGSSPSEVPIKKRRININIVFIIFLLILFIAMLSFTRYNVINIDYVNNTMNDDSMYSSLSGIKGTINILLIILPIYLALYFMRSKEII